MQGAVWVGDPDLPQKGSSRGAIIELGARNGHRGQWARTSNLLLRSLILPRKELLFCVTVRLRTWCVPSLQYSGTICSITSVTVHGVMAASVHATSLRRTAPRRSALTRLLPPFHPLLADPRRLHALLELTPECRRGEAAELAGRLGVEAPDPLHEPPLRLTFLSTRRREERRVLSE